MSREQVSKLLQCWRRDIKPISCGRPKIKPAHPEQTLLLEDAVRSIVVQFTPYTRKRVWVKVIDVNHVTEGLYDGDSGRQLWYALANLGFRDFAANQ